MGKNNKRFISNENEHFVTKITVNFTFITK